MSSMTKPEALLTTPAENAECPRCTADALAYGEPLPTASRFAPTEFAHCDSCGSTDLVDTRSPFTVLREALANIETVEATVNAAPALAALSQEARDQIIASTRMARMDVAESVRRIAAAAADPAHCGECEKEARLVRL